MAYIERFEDASAIPMGNEEALHEVINKPTERAPQQPAGISRLVTSEIHGVVSFRTWREYWDSLPIVSKLFMFMTFVDVCMVLGYAIWQFIGMIEEDTCINGNCAKKEEHLHVVLAMLVTAAFLVVFVIDAISQENDVELLACILLSFVIAGRVIYFITSAHYDTLQQSLGIVIVSIAAFVTALLGFLTYNRFGWRVYSHLASDLRVKHAAERTIMYFTRNRFATLFKLDLQFLVLMMLVGLVMSVQDSGLFEDNEYTRIMAGCTAGGFAIGLCWLGAAYYAVHREVQKLAKGLGFLCVFTFLLPVAAVVAVYRDEEWETVDARESLALSTGLFILIRILVWYHMAKLMRLASSKRDKSEKSDFHLKFRMSNKNPDLLPMLKGAWLIKTSPTSPNKRRFFQLSQDHTTLRWAWKSYVLLYYIDRLEPDDDHMTITLTFGIEPDLTVKFENPNEYMAWKRGFTVLTALLLAPSENIERHSRIDIGLDHRKSKEGSFTFDNWLNRLGVLTSRHQHGRHSHHGPKLQRPLRDAEKEFKKKQMSQHTPIAEEPQQSGKDGAHRQSSSPGSDDLTPPITAQSVVEMSDLQNNAPISTDTQGEGSGDSPSVSTTSDRPVKDNATGLLSRLPSYVETIEYGDLEIGKFLGSGAEGAVFAAWHQDTPVAVKKTNSVHELEMTLCTGQHDNVVGFRGIAREGSSTYIVLEYCPRGTLDVLLHHTMTMRWDPTKVLQLVRSIARGVLHLHTRRPAILHRDLKPANVFVSHGLVLKIGDFGMSRQLKPLPDVSATPRRNQLRRTLTPGVVGTASYTAPELLDERLQNKDYDIDRILKADVYSFGVTMWEIVQRERPFEGMEFYQIVTGWSNDPDSMRLEPFALPRGLSPAEVKLTKSMQELVDDCTRMDPDRRPNMKTVVNRLRDLHVEAQRMTGGGNA